MHPHLNLPLINGMRVMLEKAPTIVQGLEWNLSEFHAKYYKNCEISFCLISFLLSCLVYFSSDKREVITPCLTRGTQT